MNENYYIVVLLVIGPYKEFVNMLGDTFKIDQIPAGAYPSSNFAITLEKEFTVHKIWISRDKVEAIANQLSVEEIESIDFFYVAANSDIAYILAPKNLHDIYPILPKAKGLSTTYTFKNIFDFIYLLNCLCLQISSTKI